MSHRHPLRLHLIISEKRQVFRLAPRLDKMNHHKQGLALLLLDRILFLESMQIQKGRTGGFQERHQGDRYHTYRRFLLHQIPRRRC